MNSYRLTIFSLLIIVLLFCNISAVCQNGKVIDIRDQLLKSAKAADKNFPNGKDDCLTHFAYLGKLQTAEGTIYVVNMRKVLNNMSAPRGLNFILFFDKHYKFLGEENYAVSMPLWCDEGKLFLFGDIDGIENHGQGNVIDLTEGYKHLKIYHQKKYGSSGGLNDD